jgi:RHS repeat-associated protein
VIFKESARAHLSLVDVFTGKPRDPEIGLDYFGFRYSNSTLGRWMTPDPAENLVASPADPQTWNQYAYVMNNPTTWTDPNGLICVNQDGNAYNSPDDGGPGPLECVHLGGIWLDPVHTTVNVSSDGSSSIITGLGGDDGPGSSSSRGGGATGPNKVSTLSTDPRTHCWAIGIGTYISDLSPVPVPPPDDASTTAIVAASTASAGAYQVSGNLAQQSGFATAVRRKQFLDPTLKVQLGEEAARTGEWAGVTKTLGDFFAEAAVIASAVHALHAETIATEGGECNPNVF